MSETTPHTTDGCEPLLDYVYGELDEAKKAAFEEHLAGCAKCQAEAASFGKVRAAVKRVMPAVEPPAAVASGALHAQLMHAAAQRKPRRGVLLAFPRKILQHPAWAMAAMFTIVGGAVALNWSRGKLMMPVASQPAAPAPALAEKTTPLAEPEADKIGGTLELPVEKNKELTEEKAKPIEVFKGGELGKVAKDSEGARLVLDAPPAGQLTVQRPAPHRAIPAAADEKTAALKTKKVSSNRGAKLDTANDDQQLGDIDGVLGGGPASTGSSAGGFGVGGRTAATEGTTKSSAPDTLSRAGKAEESTGTRDRTSGYAAATPKPAPARPSYATQRNAPAQAPPPPAAAMPTSPAPAPAAEREMPVPQTSSSQGYYRGKQQQAVQSPAGPSKETESLRKRADEAAKSRRCDEAIRLYQELDRLSQYITPTERLNYVRCLTQKGREEEAQQRLDELKNDKRFNNAELQKVENELNDARRKDARAQKKAAPAKKPAAAPADRAAEVQQRAEPAPAEPAPPHATDTKVKSSTSY